MTVRIKKLLILFLLGFTGWGISQTKIYKGDSFNTADIVYTVNNGRVYAGNSQSWIICNLRDDKVYKMSSSYPRDILYTIRDDYRVYKRTSVFGRDIVLYMEGNRIYGSDYSLLVVLEDGKVYNGNTRLPINVKFTVEGPLKIKELAIIMLIDMNTRKR